MSFEQILNQDCAIGEILTTCESWNAQGHFRLLSKTLQFGTQLTLSFHDFVRHVFKFMVWNNRFLL